MNISVCLIKCHVSFQISVFVSLLCTIKVKSLYCVIAFNSLKSLNTYYHISKLNLHFLEVLLSSTFQTLVSYLTDLSYSYNFKLTFYGFNLTLPDNM